MRKHLITHSGQKNYACSVCKRKYMRRYDLHQHLIRMHGWVKLGRGQVVESVDAEFDLPPTPKGDLDEGVSDGRLRGPLLPYK